MPPDSWASSGRRTRNTSRTAVTASEGTYEIPFIVPGLYKLTATGAGFKDFLAEQIRITGGEPLLRRGVVDFVRELAQMRTLDGNRLDLAITTNGHLLPEMAEPLPRGRERGGELHRQAHRAALPGAATQSALNGTVASTTPRPGPPAG